MTCPGCQKEVTADRRFCTWCERYIPDPRVGTKAGVGRRLAAHFVDIAVFWGLFLLISLFLASLFGAVGGRESGAGGFILGIILTLIGYPIVLLWFLSKGLTPGKLVMSEQVVEHLGGGYPGLGRMLLRDVFGKWVSGLAFGLGYFWAIWDKDGQAWHDKIAGTLVVKRSAGIANPVLAGGSRPLTVPGTFCTGCGSRLSLDQKFCTSCGAAQR